MPEAADAMYHYLAYGLHVASQIELPSLPKHTPAGDPDVCVRVDRVDSLAIADRSVEESPWRSIDRHRAVVEFPGICAIEMSEGHSIDVNLVRGADPDVVATLIVGGILGGCLFQRGWLVLHASAVQVGDAVVAMTGPSGVGKSTLAAAFVARGYSLVTDDVLPVWADEDGCCVEPAHPGLKLCQSSLTALGLEQAGAPAVPGGWRQRSWHHVDRFSKGRCRLGAIVQLGEGGKSGSEVVVNQTASSDVFRLLLAQTLPTRAGFGGDDMHLTQLARVAGSVPGYVLERPVDLDRLNDCVTVIEQTMAALAARAVE
jgi:hypothetical protein